MPSPGGSMTGGTPVMSSHHSDCIIIVQLGSINQPDDGDETAELQILETVSRPHPVGDSTRS